MTWRKPISNWVSMNVLKSFLKSRGPAPFFFSNVSSFGRVNHTENGGENPWDGWPLNNQPHIHLISRGYLLYLSIRFQRAPQQGN